MRTPPAIWRECVTGFESMSSYQLYELGLNDSLSHTDFMIGSDDLDIDGVTAEGEIVPIFRNGTWAF